VSGDCSKAKPPDSRFEGRRLALNDIGTDTTATVVLVNTERIEIMGIELHS
jgi:hypothetical protein